MPGGPYSVDPQAWPYSGARPVVVPRGLGVAAIVLAITLTVIQVLVCAFSFSATESLVDDLRNGTITITSYDLLSVPLLVATLACYVVGCLWLGAARKNTLAIAPHSNHARGPVWVWLGWWVPIVLFWFPFQVVRDVVNASDRAGRAQLAVGGWWATWLVILIANRVSASAYGSTNPDTVETLPLWDTVGAVATVIGCVLWCRIVAGVNRLQAEAITPR